MQIGSKFNSLTQISEQFRVEYGKKDKRTKKCATFLCDCGTSLIVECYKVYNGAQKQCMSCARKKNGKLKITHGLSKHPLYRKWGDMLKRCYNPNVDRYNCYGAIGITVCDEWRYSFKPFYDWCVENKWEEHLQIDRIDVNGNYCPENCKLSTHTEQGYNKKTTKYVTIDGVKICLAKLVNTNNLPNSIYKSIWSGLKDGRPIEFYIKKHNLILHR